MFWGPSGPAPIQSPGRRNPLLLERWINDYPIDRKIVVIVMVTAMISLLVASLTFAVTDSYASWRDTREELRTLAHVLAIHSVSAVTFGDAEIAEETLASLRAKPNIIDGCLIASTTGILARYGRSGAAAQCPDLGEVPHAPRWEEGNLVVLYAVEHQGERIGSVFLRSDLSAFHARIVVYLLGMVMAISLASGIALALSTRLKRFVTAPILRLTSAVEEISVSQSYSTRVEGSGKDEIGTLIDGFNLMLDQIQVRDAQLRRARSDLEERVLVRTAQLRHEVEVRQHAERAAELRAEELARSNRELESYAYVASHDLREPLRAVSGFAQLLEKRYGGKLDEKADEYIRNIVEGPARMQEMLKGLLTYARAGSDSGPREQVRIEDALATAVANLSVRVQETGAEIIHDPLPTVRADAARLVQLFQNLIENALKFRRDTVPRIYVSAARADGYWVIRVADNGIGIDPSHRERIFELFQRLHTRREFEGTGIGLAVCQKIVERWGGRIRAEENPGGGAVFVFTLPDPEAVDAAAAESA